MQLQQQRQQQQQTAADIYVYMPDFQEIHPFAVYVSGEPDSWFSTLKLAAQTAVERKGTVEHVHTSETWNLGQCSSIASSYEPSQTVGGFFIR